MNQLISLVSPHAECALKDCAPGLFVYNNELCFKTSESYNDEVEAYYMNGAYFEPDTFSEARDDLIVQPVKYSIAPYINRAQLPFGNNWTDDLTDIEGERLMIEQFVEGISEKEQT